MVKEKLKFIHKDYVPLVAIPIEGVLRENRKNLFKKNFWLGDNVKKHLLPLMTDGETSPEILRQDELQCGTTFWARKADRMKGEYISALGSTKNKKSDTEIMKDLGISVNDMNTVAERILQTLAKQEGGKKGLISNKNATVFGYVSADEKIYTIMVGFLNNTQNGYRWGVDAYVNIPWQSGLEILSKNK